jgi:hypothetical protein
MSSAIKNEKLMVEDQVDGKWQQHYFVLTEDQIFYSEPQEEGETSEDEPHFVPGQHQIGVSRNLDVWLPFFRRARAAAVP